MEYTQKSPIELSKYVEDYHTSVKKEFEIVLTNIYNDEINKYSEIIEHIVRLPFVQAIVEENKRLKEHIIQLQQNTQVDNNETTRVVLEISDKPVTQTYQDMDEVIVDISDNEIDSDEDNESDSELSDDDEVVTVQPTFPTNVIEEEEEEQEPTADEEEQEPSADEDEQEQSEEEEEQDPSADEDEQEPSADEEDEEEEEQEQSEEEQEPSADKEPSEDEELSADTDEEETEVIELEIDDITYYCDGEENGNIYADDNGEVGDIVGELKDGEAIFH